jgi:hypothetical protein
VVTARPAALDEGPTVDGASTLGARLRQRAIIDRRTAVASVAVGLVAFAMARATMLPDIGLWDTAEAQTVPPLLGTMHPTGYPAYAILGFVASTALAPLGSPAFAMNLSSAMLLGLAAGSTVLLARLLTGSVAIAVATGLGATVTPIVWRLGVQADVHALHLALIALLLTALVGWDRARRASSRSTGSGSADRWLLAAALLGGLALANHRLTLLFAPGILAYVLAVEPGILRRPRSVVACLALSVGLAGLLYLQLPLRAGLVPARLVYGHPETFAGFWYVVLGSQFGGAVSDAARDPAAAARAVATLLGRELGPLAFVLPGAVVATVLRAPRYAILTVPGVLLTAGFAVVYDNALIERYWAVPLLVGWTWLAILADVLVRAVTVRRAPDRPARRWLARAAVAVAALVLVAPLAMTIGDRWRAVDASGDQQPRRWLEAALELLPRDAVVVSWWSYSTPLWYAQHIEGRRLDLAVVDDRTRLDEGLGDVTDVIDANLGRRPVYLIRIDADEQARLAARYAMTVVQTGAGPSLVRVDGRLADR